MIVFEDRKLVIVTPPHTASGNLHRACCRLGAYHVIGPTPSGMDYDHHVTTIGNGWLDYRVALVVRHPFERLIGLYEHHQHAAKLEGWEPIVWWQFVAMVLEQNPDLSWFYRTTICQLIGNLKVDVLIKYEDLQANLERHLDLTIDLPPPEGPRDWSPYLAQPGVGLIAEHWGRDDMERFGYVSNFTE